jgi:hypothetical protein
MAKANIDFEVTIGDTIIQENGALTIYLEYTNASGHRFARLLKVDAAGEHITDGQGNEIASPVPPGLTKAVKTLRTQVAAFADSQK